MSVPATCTKCGYQFIPASIFAPNARMIVKDLSVSCPSCGGRANVQDGTYDIVSNVVRAFHAAGPSRESVSRFRDIAKSVELGLSTETDAEAQISELGGPFLHIWRWLNSNGTAIQTIVTVISLFLVIYYHDISEADSRNDNVISRNQIVADQSVEQVEQKILAELQSQHADMSRTQTRQRPNMQTQQVVQLRRQETVISPNRHERRKAGCLARRQPLD